MPRHYFPTYDLEFFCMTLLAAFLFFACINCFMYAQKPLTGATVGLIAYSAIIFSVLFDVLFFHHQPDN